MNTQEKQINLITWDQLVKDGLTISLNNKHQSKSEYRYIYEVAEFKSKRHKNPESTEYFEEEEDTRWAHSMDNMKVSVIKVDVNSLEFQLALRYSCEKDQQDLKDYLDEHCFE